MKRALNRSILLLAFGFMVHYPCRAQENKMKFGIGLNAGYQMMAMHDMNKYIDAVNSITFSDDGRGYEKKPGGLYYSASVLYAPLMKGRIFVTTSFNLSQFAMDAEVGYIDLVQSTNYFHKDATVRAYTISVAPGYRYCMHDRFSLNTVAGISYYKGELRQKVSGFNIPDDEANWSSNSIGFLISTGLEYHFLSRLTGSFNLSYRYGLIKNLKDEKTDKEVIVGKGPGVNQRLDLDFSGLNANFGLRYYFL